ncbi:MAG: glycosyltransferase [Pseudomonadota bacterium]
MPAPLSFSVLLPTFIQAGAPKRVDQLRSALSSIVDQQISVPYEIIIIDDNSPVPISELLADAPLGVEADIRCVRQPRGNGLVQALNRGLSEAKYDLIARLDDDDIWLPGKMSHQLDRFENDPDLTILGTGMTLVFESGDAPVDHIRPDGWSPILNFFCQVGCPFPHGSILAKKNIFNLLGRYPQTAAVRHCEDYALWSIWIRFFKPGMVEQSFYNYTVSERSISSVHASRSREISQRICGTFTDLKINDIIPRAMDDLAASLDITRLQAGVVAFRMWHYGCSATLPRSALSPLRALMPDRTIFFEDPSDRSIALNDLLAGFGSAPLESAGGDPVTISCR